MAQLLSFQILVSVSTDAVLCRRCCHAHGNNIFDSLTGWVEGLGRCISFGAVSKLMQNISLRIFIYIYELYASRIVLVYHKHLLKKQQNQPFQVCPGVLNT